MEIDEKKTKQQKHDKYHNLTHVPIDFREYRYCSENKTIINQTIYWERRESTNMHLNSKTRNFIDPTNNESYTKYVYKAKEIFSDSSMYKAMFIKGVLSGPVYESRKVDSRFHFSSRVVVFPEREPFGKEFEECFGEKEGVCRWRLV